MIFANLFASPSATAKLSCPESFRLFGRKDKTLEVIQTSRSPRKPGLFEAFTSPTTDSRWLDYSRRFRMTTTYNIRRNQRLYLQAIQEKHPHIDFLKSLGYRFEITSSGRLDVVVPPLEDALKAYENIQRAHVAAGRVKAEDVLVPMRAFTTPDGKTYFVKFGDPIPVGATPQTKLLNDDQFQDVARQRGFIMSEAARGDLFSSLNTGLEHDLGHLSVFSRNPELQGPVARFNSTDWSAIGSIGGSRDVSMYLNEHMEGVGKQNRPALIELFRKHGVLTPTMLKDKPVLLSEVRKKTDKLSDQEIAALVDDIRKNRHRLIQSLGGAQSDIVEREFTIRQVRDHGPEARREYTYMATPGALIDLFKLRADTIQMRRLAEEIVTSLDNTSHFDFPEIAAQLSQPKIDPKSPAYTYFCRNRLYQLYWTCQQSRPLGKKIIDAIVN